MSAKSCVGQDCDPGDCGGDNHCRPLARPDAHDDGQPPILAGLPPGQAEALKAQLSQPTYAALAAISERVFVIMIHVFTTLLAFVAAVRSRRRAPLGAVLFKSVLDGPLPLMQSYFGASGLGMAVIEAYVAVMGLIALYGVIRLREKCAGIGAEKS